MAFEEEILEDEAVFDEVETSSEKGDEEGGADDYVPGTDT